MWFNVYPSLQPQRYVNSPHAYGLRTFISLASFKGTCVLTMTRSLSSANGLGAGKVSRGSMTASATSSCIRITAHSLATVAGSLLHGLMRSIVTVRHFPITLSFFRGSDRFFRYSVRSEGGSGCMKTQESSPDQQGAPGPFKLEPDAGGQDNWGGYEGVTV
jgi:hypothetical protein